MNIFFETYAILPFQRAFKHIFEKFFFSNTYFHNISGIHFLCGGGWGSEEDDKYNVTVILPALQAPKKLRTSSCKMYVMTFKHFPNLEND